MNYEKKFKQLWSTIRPILTKRVLALKPVTLHVCTTSEDTLENRNST